MVEVFNEKGDKTKKMREEINEEQGRQGNKGVRSDNGSEESKCTEPIKIRESL